MLLIALSPSERVKEKERERERGWKEAVRVKRRRGEIEPGTESCTTLITALEQRRGKEEGWREEERDGERERKRDGEAVNRVRLQEAAGYPQLHTTYYQRSTTAPKRPNTGNGDTKNCGRGGWRAQGDGWKRIRKYVWRMHNACAGVSWGKSINTLTCVCVFVWETLCIPIAASAEANWNSWYKAALWKTSRSWVMTLSSLGFLVCHRLAYRHHLIWRQ